MDERYKKIFQHAASGFLILDREGRILDFNPAACRLMGRERGSILHRPLDAFFISRFGQTFQERLPLIDQLGHLSLETCLRGGGEPGVDVLMDATLVPWKEGEAVLVVLRELTSREHREQEQDGLQGLLDAEHRAGTRAVFFLSGDGRARPYRPPEEDGRAGEGPLDWFAGQFASEGLQETAARAWAGERVVRPPAWYRPEAGAGQAEDPSAPEEPPERLLRITLLPLRDAQRRVRRVLATVEDCTRQRVESERAHVRGQRQALSLFSGALLQELNNYLGVILAQASSLRLSSGPGHLAPPALGSILDAAQEAAGLLRRGMEIGRGKENEWDPLDLNAPVVEAARLLRLRFSGRVQVEVELGAGLPPVRGEAELLRALVSALGRLAEAQMPAGGTLHIQTFPVDSPSPAAPPGAGLRISDSGMGLDTAARGQAVLSFLPPPGTGLGDPLDWTLAQAVLRRHRGSCAVDSAPGRGTTWRIVLPGLDEKPNLTGPLPSREKLPVEALVERKISEAAEGAAHASGGGRAARAPELTDARRVRKESHTPCAGVLLVDDEENVRDASGEMLRQAGYDVVVANDGQKGFEVFQEEPNRFDLVILDAYMPRLGGLEAYLRMQALRPNLSVLFISGFVRSASRSALKAACPGRAEVLLKPFSEEQLLAAVSKSVLGRPG